MALGVLGLDMICEHQMKVYGESGQRSVRAQGFRPEAADSGCKDSQPARLEGYSWSEDKPCSFGFTKMPVPCLGG